MPGPLEPTVPLSLVCPPGLRGWRLVVGLGPEAGRLEPSVPVGPGSPGRAGGMAPCIRGERPGAVGASPVGLGDWLSGGGAS